MTYLIERMRAIGPSLLVFFALLACKSESRKSEATGSASAAASEAPPSAEEKLDKAAVCGLFGSKSGSESCSDCVDEAEQSASCSRKAEAWGRCAGDVEKLGAKCAGGCVNQCVTGQKACCDCTTSCVAGQTPACINAYLAFQKCAITKCKNDCS